MNQPEPGPSRLKTLLRQTIAAFTVDYGDVYPDTADGRVFTTAVQRIIYYPT